MISVAFYDVVELEAQKREQQKLDYLMEEMSEAKSLVRQLLTTSTLYLPLIYLLLYLLIYSCLILYYTY